MASNKSLARARTELAFYAAAVWPRFELAPHGRLSIEYLEAVEARRIDRLANFWPPRHGKTTLVGQLYPAWVLGRHPDWSVIHASYGAELAADSGRRVRAFVSSDEHRLIFPESRIVEENPAMHRFSLTGGGSYFAVGAGGPITGRGANLLILDDLVKGYEDAQSVTARRSLQAWFESVAYTRLQPGGAIVAIGTRWHQDDILGWLLREHVADGWTVVSLPALAEPGDLLGRKEGEALWPSKFDCVALQRIREAIGSSAFAALYQQRPTLQEGAIFKREWLRSYSTKPEFNRLIFSLDTAFKTGEANDYSVLAVWGESLAGFYLLDLVRERLDFPSLKSRVVAKAAFWRPHAVLIEDAASGQSLIQSLELETNLPILPVKVTSDKESRASAISPLFESGRVHLPIEASWLSDYIDEITSFPAAPHDDQVDSTVQALSWLRGETRREYAYTPASRGLGLGRSNYPLTYATPKIEPYGEEVAAREDGAGSVRSFGVARGRGRLFPRRGAW